MGPRVIVAGFGRFGQIAGRLLLSSGVKMVVLDHDPDHIETLRKFGMKVFYGDATRMDLLESAGAAKAEVLINAIDDPQTNLQLSELVKSHFPHLQIIARARDVDHYIRLRQAWGVMKPASARICSVILIPGWWKRWRKGKTIRYLAPPPINVPARC